MNCNQSRKRPWKLSVFTFIAIMALFFGTVAMNEVKAQVFIFHDPFELTGSDVSEHEQEIVDSEFLDAGLDTDLTESIVEIPQYMVYVGIALWVVAGVVVLRIYRARKNSKMRMHMEGMNYWKMRRIAGAIVLLFLLVIPAKSQVFLDEQTRENTQYNITPKKARTLDRGTGYAPLGGGILVLGLLGGAYLIGKNKKNKD